MEKRRGGNVGQKDFQKLTGKVLDSCVVPAIVPMAWRR